MRTNVVLNDDLLREAGRYSQAKTKKGILEEALRVFVETRAAESKRGTYEQKLRELDGKLADIRLRESPFQVLKEARERSW